MLDTTSITPLDRYRGCLLGGAVGDALGAAVEFDDIATIRRRFGVEGILDPAEAYGRVGAITDDTQMTLFTAEGLLQAGDRAGRGLGDPARDLWCAYRRWLRTQGVTGPSCDQPAPLEHGELHRIAVLRSRRAPGTTCLSALRRKPKLRGGHAFPVADNSSKGCGGVMRAAPCGLVNGDETRAFGLGVRSAALTHGHPSGHLAAGALAFIVRAICDGRALGDAVDGAIHALRVRDGSDEVRDALVHARDLAAADPRRGDVAALGEGWVAEEALAIAVYCALSHADNLAAAVRRAANHSGDSDSTAAITGNIMGAMLGTGAIPAGWLEALELRSTIERLATALHDRFVLGRRDVDWGRCGDASEPAPPHDAYWVSPGRLLAGPYPGAKYGVEAEAKLEDFLDLGVTCFIDLTEAGESGLEPYAPLLRTLAERRGAQVTHRRLPIRDLDVAPPQHMRAIQEAIAGALDAGEVVYVHCWGGVGRTGTVIGCHLVERGEHSGREALAALKELRRFTWRAHRVSPETRAQRAMVQQWKAA
jgi:ADP-ribosylglycohydrolase